MTERMTHDEYLKDVERQAHEDGARRDHEARLDARAVNILETGDPREFILNTFKTLHIGDNDTGEGVLIGTMNQSIANSKGLQSSVHGESGYGKSHAARAMLHLHPLKYFMITSLTDKALFYMEADELRPGMTIFCDDAEISQGIEGIIKRSTSAFQDRTEHRVPIKEGGKFTTKKLTIPPRIDWLLTSVDSQGSDQFVKRQISYGVDETNEQDERVIEFELEKARDGLSEFPVTDDVIICRQIIWHIKRDDVNRDRLFTVKIPFADRINWLDLKNRRNLPIFLDMVKGYAILNFKQRETDGGGALIATVDDFNAAARLYNARGGFQKLHITEREKEMLQRIFNEGGELPTDELTNAMKLSARRIGRIGERLEAILPGFTIEQRSAHVKDPHDTGKSTTTRKNYYCYTGAVSVDLFGSIVSLDDDAPLGHTRTSLGRHSDICTIRVQEAQNEPLGQKEPYNNNKNNNNKALGQNVREDTRNDAPVFSPQKRPSAHNLDLTEVKTKSISSTGDGDDLDQKGRVLSDCYPIDVRVDIVKILLAAKSAGLTSRPQELADAVINKVKKRYREYDVESFYKRLAKDDKEIQGLIVDLCGTLEQDLDEFIEEI